MAWIFLALLAPALYAVTNYIDKLLISRYLGDTGEGALIIVSALAFPCFLPILYLINPNVFSVSYFDASVLMLSGIILIIYLIPYFRALKDNDASVVASLFSFIPLISLVFGYVFLGETISQIQFAGILVLVFGSLILSISLSGALLKINSRLLTLMFGSSALYVLSLVLFKYLAKDQNFVSVLFWQYLGGAIAALLFVFYRPYRLDFLKAFQNKRASFILLNALNETLTITGQGILNFCVLLAPIALVTTVANVQPFFLFAYGIILSLWAPSIFKENLHPLGLTIKFLGISMLVMGVYLIA